MDSVRVNTRSWNVSNVPDLGRRPWQECGTSGHDYIYANAKHDCDMNTYWSCSRLAWDTVVIVLKQMLR
jgi:hypothetical protein